MGFTIYYQSTDPLEKHEFAAMQTTCTEHCQGRSWLSCEPVILHEDEEGFVAGGSKPTFVPHPDDVAAAEAEGLPDGTLLDLLDVLSALSREYQIDWELSHDYSEGHPIGYVRNGKIHPELIRQINSLAELLQNFGDMEQEFGEIENQFNTPSNKWWNPTTNSSKQRQIDTGDPDEDEDEGPHLLPFKP